MLIVQVAVPHFRRKTDDTAVDKLAHVPHRKQGQQIMAELAQEQERAWGHVPLPSGKSITVTATWAIGALTMSSVDSNLF